jgi:hypothetical protein
LTLSPPREISRTAVNQLALPYRKFRAPAAAAVMYWAVKHGKIRKAKSIIKKQVVIWSAQLSNYTWTANSAFISVSCHSLPLSSCFKCINKDGSATHCKRVERTNDFIRLWFATQLLLLL